MKHFEHEKAIVIDVTSNGFWQYTIQTEAIQNVSIHVDKHINASLMFTYSGIDALIEQEVTLAQGSRLNVLYRNELSGNVTMKQQGNITQDAFLNVAYCELGDSTTTLKGTFDLLEEGAQTLIRSATICAKPKHFTITCTHHAPHTTGKMEHYAVIEEHGDYYMEACGKIVKGAYGSESHQTTRVLTMSETQCSEVIPLLLINENDVKASHATTLGQPDENQLYYLQTRGLSRQQALGLLTVGYMMPITEILDDEDINASLKNEIEMKVGLHV